MATRQSLQQQLETLSEKLEPRIRAAFLASIADVTNTVVLAQIVVLLEAGNAAGAFQALGLSDAAMRPLTAILEESFETFGRTVANSFPRFKNGVFRFDVRNTTAENWLREQSSRLITAIKEDARVNIMNALEAGMQRGENPRTTALDIVGRVNPATGKREGGLIGLTQQQEVWVRNARADLENLGDAFNRTRYFGRNQRAKGFDKIVERAIAEGKPLDKATIDRLISKYKDNMLRYRGEVIARTESIQSLNRAQYESYRQAVENGATKAQNVRREWDTAGDARVRHSHARMDGQTVGLDEPFRTPSGEYLMFPGDTSLGASAKETIQCRCRVKFKTDWLADID